MRKHNAEKEFWQTAVLLISRTHSFTQAHIKHLEWLSIQKAREASRFAVENGNEGSAPHVPEPMQADLEDIFSTASVLLGALGYPVFEPVAGAITIKAPGGPVVSGGEELFECTGPSAKATGRMVEDGFVVLKGSLARAQLVKSAKDSFVENKQQELLAEGILVQEGESLRFAEDYRFNTPSGAAMVVLGRHANGWTEWWLNGKSLDQLKRASDKKAGGR
jgi:hypothetical protein